MNDFSRLGSNNRFPFFKTQPSEHKMAVVLNCVQPLNNSSFPDVNMTSNVPYLEHINPFLCFNFLGLFYKIPYRNEDWYIYISVIQEAYVEGVKTYIPVIQEAYLEGGENIYISHSGAIFRKG